MWCVAAVALDVVDRKGTRRGGRNTVKPSLGVVGIRFVWRACVLTRRHRTPAESTRRDYRRRLERALDAIMVLAPVTADGKKLRKRYGKVHDHLFTFLDHPETTADNNSSERELRPTATFRKVTGGFRSLSGANLFAAVRSIIGTAKRRGIDAYQAIVALLRGQSVLLPG